MLSIQSWKKISCSSHCQGCDFVITQMDVSNSVKIVVSKLRHALELSVRYDRLTHLVIYDIC